MKCPICGTEEKYIFSHDILNKYEVSYYKCPNCKFMNTEKPYWLNEAYSSAINSYDTGIMGRNEAVRKMLFNLITLGYDTSAKFRDFGGGHGILTRMMRDWGLDYYWSDKYADNLFARGFEYQDGMTAELTSAVEVFEHMDQPMQDISDMLKYSDSVFFTTIPYTTVVGEEEVPDESWWYYGFHHGQHISFYSKYTLKWIAEYFGLNFYKIDGGDHLISKRRFSDLRWNYIKANLRFEIGVEGRRRRYGQNLAPSDMDELVARYNK